MVLAKKVGDFIKKKVAIILSTGIILSPYGIESANAETNNADLEKINVEETLIETKNDTLLGEYSIGIKTTLKVDNSNIPLYCEFTDGERALKEIKGEASHVLNILQSTYGLEELSADNWKSYVKYLFEYLDREDKETWYDENNLEFRKLRQFFHIYENTEKNIEIISEVEAESNSKELLGNKDFLSALPYSSVQSISYEKNVYDLLAPQPSVLNLSNNAITYAKLYGNTRNSSYASFSADCTNFASQIMAAGGQSQSVTSSVNTGWWHKYTVRTHVRTHSRSWTVANNFVTYFGISGGGSYHRSFGTSLRAGDYIAADYEDDGDWDHIGFVVEKSSSLVTSNGSTFYDYKVAQHTSDYCLWTSDSRNGWETIGIDGGDYAFIRR